MTGTYEVWLDHVRDALSSINMPMEDWQHAWAFDFEGEYGRGTDSGEAAARANRFWWHHQNKAIQQDCRVTANCWLPRAHQGECQPES
jgi:hypothetical protein